MNAAGAQRLDLDLPRPAIYDEFAHSKYEMKNTGVTMLLTNLFVIAGIAHAATTAPAPPWPPGSMGVQPAMLLVADNEVRAVPKNKPPQTPEKPAQQDPPKLPPSAIPGAANPRDGNNYSVDPSTPTTRVPTSPPEKDHCIGSGDCSKIFDNGKGG
ncbi:hypothetical protein FAZ69_27195 [Trinickia terrae]|uniref:Uncharacterized protein n=1 Tax=Trinickia terrae TaxID=2571161 RepID=A0A4U1HQ53_9BURK|nr:hypothetical protein [Trinickia terrae]TKC81654.1 hypothetical protein FAZ69_27195 [Trinickia terrae]